jgi:hypothetical protein
MSMTDAWPRFTCAQYDGTAASVTDVMDVANLVAWEDWDLISATPAGCVIKERRYESTLTIGMNGWVMRNGMDAIRIYTSEEFPLTFSRRRAVVQEAADVSYFGSGIAQSAVSIGIGIQGTVNVRVDPPVPASSLDTVKLKSVILSTTGAGTVQITSTPTVATALVPASTVNGVAIPEHTVVRTLIRNVGVGVLSSVQVYTTAHV